MTHRLALPVALLLGLALTACSTPADDSVAPTDGVQGEQSTDGATAPQDTGEAEPEGPAGDSFAAEVDAANPGDDWEAADSPALALSSEERAQYMEDVAGSFDFSSVTASDDSGNAISADQSDALVAVVSPLPRVGKEIVLVSLAEQGAEQSAVEGGEAVKMDAAVVLEYGWNVCNAVDGGQAYEEAFGTAFGEALGLGFEAGLSDDEDAMAAAQVTATSAMFGAMFAFMLCPDYMQDALDSFQSLSQMGQE
ncbi:hypothetical protein [Demequina sp.]|uniref:hypothetical protein n=1 Tax=Demequina sp. TaxID=2050685 RepID=UPI003A862C4C